MELKHNNPNSEITLASELKPGYQFFSFEIIKLHSKILSYMFFFKKMLKLLGKYDCQ